MTEPTPRKLSHYFTASRRKGRAGLPLMSVTMHNGLVRRDELDRKMDSALTPEEHLLVEPNDIAYNTMRMWQGCFGLAEEAANVSPAYVVMRPRDTVDPRFAAHWFKSDRGLYMLWAYSYGLTEDRLRLYEDEFLLIPVSWPDRAEQSRIARLLDTWDGAIVSAARRHEQRLEHYRALVRKLYSNSDSSTYGVETFTKLKAVASVSGGSSDVGVKQAGTEGEPLFTAGGIVGSYLPAQNSGDAIILSAIGARCGKCFFAAGKWTAGANTMVIRPNSGLNPRYLFHYLDVVQPWLIQGSGQPYISPTNANATLVPICDRTGQDKVSKILDCAENLSLAAQAHVEALRRQKRGLMQKLLTGEWPVPESIDRLMPGGDAAATLAREANAA